MMLINDTKKYIVFRLPKNASGTLHIMFGKGCKRIDPIHGTVIDARNKVKKDKFKNYFKFALVRNPWDRLLSEFTFIVERKKISHNIKFKDWLLHHQTIYSETNHGITPPQYKRIPFQRRPQLSWLVDENNEILVDFIGKVETIYKDIAIICDRFNVELDKSVPTHHKTTHKTYKEMYDEEMKNFIYTHHQIDIDTFGYEF